MNFSIVVIFDKIRKEKLLRLLNSMKDQLENRDGEVLLIHESNEKLVKPDFLPQLPVTLKYINIKEKQGISFNRNQGIKNSKGKIIIFIDDDCWVQENWLSSLLEPLQDENILAVTSGTKIPRSNLVGDCISSLGFPGGGSLGFEKVWKISRNGMTNHLAVGNCALRKKLFGIVGNFDETMKSGAEDAELSHRMEKAGIFIKYSSRAYAFHEARTTFKEFVKWQLRRGKANYQFKQRVGKVGGFIKLRIWSAKNVFKANCLNPKLPLIFFFLALSFSLQQIGYYQEKRKKIKLEHKYLR